MKKKKREGRFCFTRPLHILSAGKRFGSVEVVYWQQTSPQHFLKKEKKRKKKKKEKPEQDAIKTQKEGTGCRIDWTDPSNPGYLSLPRSIEISRSILLYFPRDNDTPEGGQRNKESKKKEVCLWELE